MSIRNVKITGAFLGEEDHGIPTYMISTYCEGLNQGFGGYDLRHYRIDMVFEIMKTVGVRNWDDLIGKYIRVDEQNGLLKGIGHITEDTWYYPNGKFKD